MNKLLLGILIGLGITASGLVFADYTGQSWHVPAGGDVYKMRDGKVICYVFEYRQTTIGSAISCLTEPQ